jgi:excisionase family DNA binding protein
MKQLVEAIHLVGGATSEEITTSMEAFTIQHLERYISRFNLVKQIMEWKREKLLSKGETAEYLTVKEAAILLKTSTVTIYSMIKSGKLKAKKINTKIRINYNEILLLGDA